MWSHPVSKLSVPLSAELDAQLRALSKDNNQLDVIADEIHQAAFWYRSMVSGSRGLLDGSVAIPSNPPRRFSRLLKQLKGIRGATSRIAEVIGAPDTKKKAASLISNRVRLLGYFGPPGLSSASSASSFSVDDLQDGSGDSELVNALCPNSAIDEPQLIEHVRILVERNDRDSVLASADWLDARAEAAESSVSKIKSWAVRPGHSGDRALAIWLDAMLTIWRDRLGQEIATSVHGPQSDNEGEACGPLILFLESAAKPLGISIGSDALRSQIRDALQATGKKGADLDRLRGKGDTRSVGERQSGATDPAMRSARHPRFPKRR